MSFSKRTLVSNVLTSVPLSLLVEPIPYALVTGNGDNDAGLKYVLCYAQIGEDMFCDVRVQADKFDLDDRIFCKSTQKSKVCYDARAIDGEDGQVEAISRAKLKPIELFFAVVNLHDDQTRTGQALLATSREEAESMKAEMERQDVFGAQWRIVELTPKEVLTHVQNGLFTGLPVENLH